MVHGLTPRAANMQYFSTRLNKKLDYCMSRGVGFDTGDIQYKTALSSSSCFEISRCVKWFLSCTSSVQVASVCKEMRLFRMCEAQFVRSNWLQTVISLAAFTSVFSSAEEMSASSRSITACARLCGGGVCVQHSSVGPLNAVNWPFLL